MTRFTRQAPARTTSIWAPPISRHSHPAIGARSGSLTSMKPPYGLFLRRRILSELAGDGGSYWPACWPAVFRRDVMAHGGKDAGRFVSRSAFPGMYPQRGSLRVARYPDTAGRRALTNHESYNQAGPRPDHAESLASTSRVERLEVTDSPRRRPEFPAVRSTRSRSALARTNSRRPARSSQPIVGSEQEFLACLGNLWVTGGLSAEFE